MGGKRIQPMEPVVQNLIMNITATAGLGFVIIFNLWYLFGIWIDELH